MPDFQLASARQHYRLPVPTDRFRIGDDGEIESGISLSSSIAPYFRLASGRQHYQFPSHSGFPCRDGNGASETHDSQLPVGFSTPILPTSGYGQAAPACK
ncbi:hypothetical protein NN561_020261 [Cricetulus griseus]